MKKMHKIIASISVAVLLTLIFYFAYCEIFINSYVGESHPQPFFVNCTYYIYPNGTYLVLNITQVIQLGNTKPVLYFEDGHNPHFFIDPPPPYSKQRIKDKDHNKLLSVGDQIFFSMDNQTLWNITISLWYEGPDANGHLTMGVLWDSERGPYIWKNNR